MVRAERPSSKTATGTIDRPPSTALTVAQARARILERVAPLDAEDVHLPQGHGRVLAEDVHAQRHVPPFADSAMDGYAVRAVHVRGACRSQPARLRLLG